MNILSLFDGMSCGQIALNRLGIKYDNYFASEIDKHAIIVTQANYPNTIQLGDVRQVNGKDLPRIDLLIGGSPCQGFSMAGKQLNFEDPRSKLFFEYVRLLKECKPKYFLLENVVMKREYQDIITDYLKVDPILINSALVSAQNRKRLYWTNIAGIKQPKDKGICLIDIIESGIVDRDKSHCIDANYFKGGNINQYFNKSRRQLVFSPNSLQLIGKWGEDQENYFAIAQRGRYDDNHKVQQQLETSLSLKSNSLTTVTKDSLLLKLELEGYTVRKLTPLECERLQTVEDNYTNHVSNTQRYRMLGNGWTVDVIAHILKNMNLPAKEPNKDVIQLSLF